MSDKLSAQPWHDEISRYQEEYKKWTERGEKIVKRYRDERKDAEQADARFNILWSNVQTLKPAIYAKPPNPEISRRFDDRNDAGRVASIILERVLDFEIKEYHDFHDTLSCVVDDRLLPGRGVAWLRYEPKIEEFEPQITNYTEVGDSEYTAERTPDEENGLAQTEVYEQVVSETTPVDYVYWQDFAHLPARTWDEVTWVARRVYMTLDEGIERFGDIFEKVPLTNTSNRKDGDKETTKADKKAEIWEIWCKAEKCVYWIADNYDVILDHRDDPLGLTSFYPCPKPYFATTSTGTLIPVADFLLYQDQADEIDELTGRIKHLTKALKVMGIYAADEPAIERLMKEGNDGVLVPVKNWAAFVEKGGLQGAVQFMPLGDVASALQQLYQARESCKQIIYETTGLSDIMRGASVASETATAQQIKSQFASLRLGNMKDGLYRFAREILRMKSEIICSKYQPQTLIEVSGIMNTPDAQFAQQAIELLKNEPARVFNVDIQTDTLVELDKQTEKANRMEFLQAVSSFIKDGIGAVKEDPAIAPLVGELLLYGVRGFKAGRELEGVLEQFVDQAAKKAQGPQPPSKDEQRTQAEAQIAQMKMQAQQQSEQATMQLEQVKLQASNQLEQAKLEFDRWKTQLDNDTRIAIAQIQAQNSMKQHVLTLNAGKDADAMTELDETGTPQVSQLLSSSLGNVIDSVNMNMTQMMTMANQQNQALLDRMSEMHNQVTRPKQVVRDANGKIIGVK